MDSIPGEKIDYIGLNINVEKDPDTGDVSLARDSIQAPVLGIDDFEKGPVSAGSYSGLTEPQKSELDTVVENATSFEDLLSNFYDLVEAWRVDTST